MIRLAIILILLAQSVFAANGEILYQNCTSAVSCNPGNTVDPTNVPAAWTRSVETTGCHSGSCLKLVGTIHPLGEKYGAGNTSIPTGSAVLNKTELTVQYWVKLSEAGRGMISGNLKMFLPYVSTTAINHRWGSVVIPQFGHDFYVSRLRHNTFRPAPWFSPTISSVYATNNGDGTYYTNQHYINGNANKDTSLRPGTSWVKFTHYYKVPSSPTAYDGVAKVWMNDELMLDIWNAGYEESPTGVGFVTLTFYSSSEAGEPFEHWMDDMIIYEGYVPPVSDPGPVLSNPNPSSILPYSTTSYSPGNTTSVAATCRYGTVAGVPYANKTLVMTGTGTTSHHFDLSGLTPGFEEDYYVRCAKTSDGEVNTVDFPIHVEVDNQAFTLTTIKEGSGDGTVTSVPASATRTYATGTSVTLTATPNASSVFTSWTGCGSTSGTSCTVSMVSDKSVTVTFGTPSTADCTSDYRLCSDLATCEAAGNYYYLGACRSIAEETDTTGSNLLTDGAFTTWSSGLPVGYSSYTPTKVSDAGGSVLLNAVGSISQASIYKAYPAAGTYRYYLNVNMSSSLEFYSDEADGADDAQDNTRFHYATDGSNRTITGLITYEGPGTGWDSFSIVTPAGTTATIDDLALVEWVPPAPATSRPVWAFRSGNKTWGPAQ